jgi:hypothetical protein
MTFGNHSTIADGASLLGRWRRFRELERALAAAVASSDRASNPIGREMLETRDEIFDTVPETDRDALAHADARLHETDVEFSGPGGLPQIADARELLRRSIESGSPRGLVRDRAERTSTPGDADAWAMRERVLVLLDVDAWDTAMVDERVGRLHDCLEVLTAIYRPPAGIADGEPA